MAKTTPEGATDAGGAGGDSLLDPGFVEDLRCPLTLKPLVEVDGRLLCYESRKAYPIEDGIPILLADEATEIPEDQLPEEFRGKPPVTTRD